jgi:hypothetical protein
MILDGFSNDEICNCLNMKRSSLYAWMKKIDIVRIRKSSAYQKYQRKVRWLTEKNY